MGQMQTAGQRSNGLGSALFGYGAGTRPNGSPSDRRAYRKPGGTANQPPRGSALLRSCSTSDKAQPS